MAQKLLGVVNGLQMLEDNFLKVLMEAALKLASVTDVPVFILCETQDGRRFAGQSELCQLYRNGALLPAEADVEMEINVGNCELRERFPPLNEEAGGVDESAPENHVTSPNHDADVVPLPNAGNRKRPAATVADDSSHPHWVKQKQRKSLHHHHHPPRASTESLETPPLPPMSLDDQWNWENADDTMDVKAFPCELDDEGALAVYPDGGGNATNGGGGSGHLPSTHLEKLDRIVERWRPPRPPPKRANSLSSIPPLPPPPSDGVDQGGGAAAGSSNFDLKVVALKQIAGHKLEQTNSDEFRLMSSCMYEFGRKTAEMYMERLAHSPELPHRRFFVQQYEDWAIQFANIHPFGNVMIKKENRESKRTLTAYMRKIAGDAFGICLRKKMKKLKEIQMRNFEYSNPSQPSGPGSFDTGFAMESSESFLNDSH